MNKQKHTNNINKHAVFFAIVGFLFLVAIVRLYIWDKGQASDYDPTEITTEFDTEALDYIQPLSATQKEGIIDDGITSILTLGNSPFAENDYLVDALADSMDATIYNGGFSDSYQTMKYESYSTDYVNDGVSLYHVVSAITSGDYTILDEASSILGGDAPSTVATLKEIDFSTLDMITIMYDISDYLDLRSLIDLNDDTNLLTYTGALKTSIDLIQEAYPHIRIIVISMPASGKTIDDYYVDGDIQNLGNGTLPDYLLFEIDTCMAEGVSIIDIYYGVIHVDNRDQYLENEYFLNEAGAKAVAERFATLIY